MSAENAPQKERWSSRWGFILAASGSAIGLGNIVFFSANAYQYGAGAFYLPYLIALVLIGVPLMILEFGLGHHTGEAFPQSLRRFAGKPGEFVGWWAIMNATFIVMYYVTILAWVVGMMVGSLGEDLWGKGVALPQFGIEEGQLGNGPTAYFFSMISSWWIVGAVVFVWILNALIVSKGVRSIEVATKVLVPTMWVMMIGLIIYGLTYDNGIEGVKWLFTPQWEVMQRADVWQGALGQIFFSLSLGFGIMTAYASRLPKQTDIPSTAMSTSFLNCSFEFIAGIAIFSILFQFVVVPKASTLSMMFFIVPTAISKFGAAVKVFGLMFFLLLLLAGLSSSISLVEALAAAAIDKWRASRTKVILIICVAGLIGSVVFGLPMVVDKAIKNNGTLGLTLVDLFDHWAQKYGLLMVGLIQCLILGWSGGAERVADSVNQSTKTLRLGSLFLGIIRFVIPAALVFILGWNVYEEMTYDPDQGKHGWPYGNNFGLQVYGVNLATVAVVAWFGLATLAALILTLVPGAKKEEASA